MKAPVKFKWWSGLNWQSISLGLVSWTWKPVIKADWEKPMGGMCSNGLDDEQVTLRIEWLTACFQFTIDRPNFYVPRHPST